MNNETRPFWWEVLLVFFLVFFLGMGDEDLNGLLKPVCSSCSCELNYFCNVCMWCVLVDVRL